MLSASATSIALTAASPFSGRRAEAPPVARSPAAGVLGAEILLEVLLILAVGAVASGIRAWLFDSAACRVMARLRIRLFTSLMAQEMGAPPMTRVPRPRPLLPNPGPKPQAAHSRPEP